MGEAKCGLCGELKKRSEFYKDPRRKNKLTARCKECIRKATKRIPLPREKVCVRCEGTFLRSKATMCKPCRTARVGVTMKSILEEQYESDPVFEDDEIPFSREEPEENTEHLVENTEQCHTETLEQSPTEPIEQNPVETLEQSPTEPIEQSPVETLEQCPTETLEQSPMDIPEQKEQDLIDVLASVAEGSTEVVEQDPKPVEIPARKICNGCSCVISGRSISSANGEKVLCLDCALTVWKAKTQAKAPTVRTIQQPNASEYGSKNCAVCSIPKSSLSFNIYPSGLRSLECRDCENKRTMKSRVPSSPVYSNGVCRGCKKFQVLPLFRNVFTQRYEFGTCLFCKGV